MEVERKAWECPRCQKVNAPHVDQCDCAPDGMTYAEVVKKYFNGEDEPQPEQSPLTDLLRPPYKSGTVTSVVPADGSKWRIWYTTSNDAIDYSAYLLSVIVNGQRTQ